jgi:hypothetical protein
VGLGGGSCGEVSRNPAGKRKGTRNPATILAAALAADEGGTVARVVIDKAVAGDAVTARFLLGLMAPKPRGRTIELDLPACNSPDDIVAAFDVTVAAMAAGEITPHEALDEGKAPALTGSPGDVGGDAARAAPAAPDESRAATTSAPAMPDLHAACNSRQSVELDLLSISNAAQSGDDFRPTMPGLHATCNSRQSARPHLFSTSNLTQIGTIAWRPPSGGGSGLDRRPAPILNDARG